MEPATPTIRQRIPLLDIARGFAILGTLGTNIWGFAKFVDFDRARPETFGEEMTYGLAQQFATVDSALATISNMLTNGKFLGLLTVLFGVGVEILYRSAQRRGTAWPRPYLWRSFLLFVIGVLHYVFVYSHDVLMGYAIAAMIVAIMLTRSERAQRICMWVAAGLHALAVVALTAVMSMSGLVDMDRERLEALMSRAQELMPASYLDEVALRLEYFMSGRAEAFGILPMCVLLYFVGVRLFRAGVFSSEADGRALRRRLMVWGLGLGLPLTVLAYAYPMQLDVAGRYVAGPLVGLGYLGLLGEIVDRGRLPRTQRNLAAVGKAALTCYLLQNALSAVLFSSWGFGLASAHSVGVLLSYAGVCVILVVAARVWLLRFPSGPVELAWRWLSALPFERRGPRAPDQAGARH